MHFTYMQCSLTACKPTGCKPASVRLYSNRDRYEWLLNRHPCKSVFTLFAINYVFVYMPRFLMLVVKTLSVFVIRIVLSLLYLV